MKDDTSQEKKSQQSQEDSEANQPSSKRFPKDEEDVDFEILDALEQLDNEKRSPDTADTVELTLDEEDIIFGEGQSEKDTGFQFDEDVSAGLEKELLDQEETHEDMDLSFDEEIDLDLEETAFDTSDEMSFELDEADDLGMFSETESESGIGEFSLDLEDDMLSEDFDIESEETGFGEADVEISSVLEQGERGEDEDLEGETEDSSFDLGELSSPDNLDLDFDDIDDTPDEFNIEDDFSDLESDIDISEEADFDTGFLAGDPEKTSDEFQDKTTISVGDDEVIDLGSEKDLGQEESALTSLDSWEENEEEQFIDIRDGLRPSTEDIAANVPPEQDQAEDFMTSLEDIDLDLEAEATKELEDQEEQERVLEQAFFEETPAVDVEDDFPLTSDPEMVSEEPASEEEPSAEEMVSEVFQEPLENEEALEKLLSSEMIDETEALEAEEPEEPTESVTDERELLELTLRLSDEQMEKFEGMVNEARTLQRYLDGLEANKTEIKEIIFQKLHEEYISRKTEIFGAPEFVNIFTDVEQDLQDMLVKRTEFVATIDRLNEELEEITVRHMVGEYNDSMLGKKEETQKAEIALWNEKTEKIEHFITRYQESLDAEQELNPLRKEEETLEDAAQEPEIESVIVTSTEDVLLSEEEVLFSEEPAQAEEQEPDETSLLESLADIGEEIPEEFDEESPAESEFSLDSVLTEEDLDFDKLSKIADELVEEETISSVIESKEEIAQDEEFISCKKCGRQTPASDKFCVNCGAKAQ